MSVLLLCGTKVVAANSPATPYFTDDFASGSRTDANGVAWGGGGAKTTVSTDRAYNDTYALKLIYNAKAEETQDLSTTAEQRMYLGQDLTQFWMEYYLYVPSNYTHRNLTGIADNNKFFSIYSSASTSPSATQNNDRWRGVIETLPGTGGKSTVRCATSRSDSAAVLDEAGNNTADFFGGTGPITIGGWNRVRHWIKMASGRLVGDGRWVMWVNDTTFVNVTAGDFWNFSEGEPTPTVVTHCYMMGAANSGFSEETTFHIDAVKLYDTNPGWTV